MDANDHRAGGTPQGLRSTSRLSAGSASGSIGPAHCDGSGADSRGVVGQAVRVAERVCVREIDDDEGRRLVRILRRGTGSVVTWRRAHMILLSAQGMPVAKIAEVTFTSADRFRDVIHSFNTDGFASLYPKYKGGPTEDLQPFRTPGDQEDRQVQAGRARPAVLDVESGQAGRLPGS